MFGNPPEQLLHWRRSEYDGTLFYVKLPYNRRRVIDAPVWLNALVSCCTGELLKTSKEFIRNETDFEVRRGLTKLID